MDVISVVVLTILACGVSSEDKFTKEKTIFHAFLEEIYGNGYEIEEFVDLMWPRVQQAVPKMVNLPAVEIFMMDSEKNYMCATNSSIIVYLGKIVNKKLLLKSKDKVIFEVDAEMFINGKPLELGIAKKLKDNKASPTVPVSYMFREPCTVRFELEIVNFLGQRNVLSPMCVMKMKSVLVIGVSRPEELSDITDPSLRDIEETFLDNFNEEDAKEVGTVALVKAINDNLKSHADFWLCSSNYFDKVYDVYEKEWEYSENYSKYCLKKEKVSLISP